MSSVERWDIFRVRGDRGLSRCLGPRPETSFEKPSKQVRSRVPTPALTTPTENLIHFIESSAPKLFVQEDRYTG